MHDSICGLKQSFLWYYYYCYCSKNYIIRSAKLFWAPQPINFITHNSIVPVPVSGYIISVQEVSVQNKC